MIYVESVPKVRQKKLSKIQAEYLSGICAKSEVNKYQIFDEIMSIKKSLLKVKHFPEK